MFYIFVIILILLAIPVYKFCWNKAKEMYEDNLMRYFATNFMMGFFFFLPIGIVTMIIMHLIMK